MNSFLVFFIATPSTAIAVGCPVCTAHSTRSAALHRAIRPESPARAPSRVAAGCLDETVAAEHVTRHRVSATRSAVDRDLDRVVVAVELRRGARVERDHLDRLVLGVRDA